MRRGITLNQLSINSLTRSHLHLIIILGILVTPFICYGEGLLNHPQKIVIDSARNRLLVSNEGDGSIVMIDSLGHEEYFVQNAGFIDGMDIVGDTLYGVGNQRALIAYDLNTGAQVMYKNFSGPGSHYLSSVTSDSTGHLFISCPPRNTIYKFRISDQSYWIFAINDSLNQPNGILLERDKNRLVIIDDSEDTSLIHAISLTDSTVTTLARTNFDSPDGIVRDKFNNYIVGGFSLPGLYRFNPDFSGDPVMFFSGSSMVYPTYDPSNHSILITHYTQSTWERVMLSNSGSDNHVQESIGQNLSNYPNPFNPETTIEFNLHQKQRVDLTIYNVKGQKVKTLFNSLAEKGKHRIVWNGKDNSGRSVGSGVFFYRLNIAGKQSIIRKCILIK